MAKKHLRVFTSRYIKRYIVSRYGELPFADTHNLVGTAIMQESLVVQVSSRLFSEKPIVFEGFLTQVFYNSLVSYVDGQRDTGLPIKIAVSNFLEKNKIAEEELSLKAALKMYDRYRTDIRMG